MPANFTNDLNGPMTPLASLGTKCQGPRGEQGLWFEIWGGQGWG